ncbi:MAG: hypothetical protein HYZ15_00895 [Sphingobacteriales bacterium]|nr:hypothetical protein [Sphingobacteriales bacterium]
MKNIFLLLLLVASLTGRAQKTDFDIASFKIPGGWKKELKNDLVILNAPENKNNTFCIITVYKSIGGSGEAVSDFQAAWKGLVTDRLSITETPAAEKGEPVNGWSTNTGTAAFSIQGTNAVAMLTTFSGYNKAMSILVITNDPASPQTLDNFFNSIDLKKPAVTKTEPAPASTAGALVTPGSLSDYTFTAPPGWTTAKSTSEITLSGPDKQSTLSLLPMAAGSGNLETDMQSFFWQVFDGFEKDPYNPDHHIITKGVSHQGWNYRKEEMGIRKMVNGNYIHIYGFVMLVQLGNQVAIIAGSFANSGSLLWEITNADWLLFFHSLSFKNYKGTAVNPLQQSLPGKWFTGSYSGILTYTFAANGHYANGAAFSTTREVSAYQLLEKTTSFVGDGTYTLKGNILTLTNADTKKTVVYQLRIYDQFQYGGWTHHIGMLSTPAGGKPYEVTLVIQKE